MIFALVPAPITELSMQSGFDLQLKDLGGLGHEQLMAARDQLLQLAAKDARLSGVRAQGMEDEPQLKIEVDQEKASALGVSIWRLERYALHCVWLGLREQLRQRQPHPARHRAAGRALPHEA